MLQFAKARGAKTLRHGRRCRRASLGADRLGADGTANYKTDDVAAQAAKIAPHGFNVYWDTSGHIDFDQAIGLLAPVGGSS